MTDLLPDTVTWMTGAPMRLVDRGMVEHEWTDAKGVAHVVSYRVGVIVPLEGE